MIKSATIRYGPFSYKKDWKKRENFEPDEVVGYGPGSFGYIVPTSTLTKKKKII